MDRRLIQTAVFGSPDSDEPALCPETVEELDAFRREYENTTIWCGTKFEGGCGRRLTTRRCTDKICHFAHYGADGAGQPCSRTAKGRDSADHFFAKAHLLAWLRTHNLSATFSYPEPPGSAVRAELADGRTFLLHLDRNRPVPWDDDAWEIVLGPGVPVVGTILEQRGYVHRIRFEDRPGGGRAMRFGTELHRQGTTWENLDDVTLTARGLATADRPDGVRVPVAEAFRGNGADGRAIVAITRSDPDPYTASTARQDDAVKLAVMHLDRALREQHRIHAAVKTIERLLEADQKPEDVARLRLALSRGLDWTGERARHRRAILDRLKEQPTAGLLEQVSRLMKDPDVTPEEHERVHAARAQLAQDAADRRQRGIERRRLQAEESRLELERRRRAERDLAEAAERQEQAEKLAYLAPFVSGALKKAAREGRTTTWEEIAQKTGQRQLVRLTYQDRLSILETIEKNTLPGSPLWSAVLAAAGTGEALRLHREVSHLLQRDVLGDDSDLVIQLTADCAQLRRQ
ncbi:hypothetical protein ACWCQL_32350 [Streptomyces sp. NPDC002073]